MTGAEIISHLSLEPLPVEGIWFRQTWRGSEVGPEDTPIGSAIYGLITDEPDCFSAMHVLSADEIWHFYAGDPLEVLLLHPDGTHTTKVLGRDLRAGHMPQVIVPAGAWMGADLLEGGTYCLFGTTMAPGFTSDAFTNGDMEDLCARWPGAADRIRRLCRPGAPTHMPEGY